MDWWGMDARSGAYALGACVCFVMVPLCRGVNEVGVFLLANLQLHNCCNAPVSVLMCLE